MKNLSQITLCLLLGGVLTGCGSDNSNSTPPPVSNIDVIPPVISIAGDPSMVHQIGINYSDAGASAKDNRDGDIEVSISGSVNIERLGSYEIIYEASDKSGNSARAIRKVEVVSDQFYDFYTNTEDRDTFEPSYVKSLETLIYASDDVLNNDYASAREKVKAIFQEQPYGSRIWDVGVSFPGYQFANHTVMAGHPVAYYAMRMMEDIVDYGDQPATGEYRVTALIPTCADVERPTNPSDLNQTEIVRREIDPVILENDGAILREAADIFGRWVEAISGGLRFKLSLYEVDECPSVSFNVGSDAFFAIPRGRNIVSTLPLTVQNQTDAYWLIYPSPVPGDGSEYSETFITGGMGRSHYGQPIFIADDMWIIRKPAHLGKGPYSTIERRSYIPQWLQHEFMHHVYELYPEFELEKEDHQWFNRTKWPDDFDGVYEPDYYIESIKKRISTAEPPLSKTLKFSKTIISGFTAEDQNPAYASKPALMGCPHLKHP